MDETINNPEQKQTEEKAKRTVTLHGKAFTLLGNEITVGMKAPDFRVTDNEMLPMKFSRTFGGRIAVISSVLSLDTSVCDVETRRFNKEAADLGPDVNVLTVSMDLPFAQKRWCGAAGVSRVRTFSDFQKAAFGKAYGVLIKELRLLARAVFIVDRDGIIKYAQIMPEAAKEPDYAEVLNAVKAML